MKPSKIFKIITLLLVLGFISGLICMLFYVIMLSLAVSIRTIVYWIFIIVSYVLVGAAICLIPWGVAKILENKEKNECPKTITISKEEVFVVGDSVVSMSDIDKSIPAGTLGIISSISSKNKYVVYFKVQDGNKMATVSKKEIKKC